MKDRLLLGPLARFGDLALLGLRLLTGAFLVRLALPGTLSATAPIFVQAVLWVTLAVGVALVLGLMARLAGLLCALAGLAALLTVHQPETVREAWPIVSLLLAGFLIAALGPGRVAMDHVMSPGRLALTRLAKLRDIALLAARLGTGLFLIHGVWDNISDAARMEEFRQFLTANHFVMPELMAPLSVYAQFLCGLTLLPGLFTRLTGLILIFNFVVALLMVHWGQSFTLIWPAAILVAFAAVFATIGAGRLSIDRRLETRS